MFLLAFDNPTRLARLLQRDYQSATPHSLRGDAGRRLAIENMINDLRYAIRMLCKSPGFTAVAVFTLALGVGAATTIFSVVNAVMLQPLPYAEPDRLLRLYTEFPWFPHGGLQRFAVSPPEYLDLRRETKSWAALDAWTIVGVNVAGDAQPTRATGSGVTGGLLRSLGVTPMLGRLIAPEDDAPGGPQVTDLSYGLWQRAFAGNPGIVGRDILLDGSKSTVIGVMPKGFQFPPGEIDPSELWAPMQIDPANPGGRAEHILNLLGRLRPGVTAVQAQAELHSVVKRLGETGSGHRLDLKDHPVVIYGLRDEVVRGVRPALRMLLGAVGFLLLIACVNVANLLLARAEARQREIAIRGALGAGVGRLARQFMTEGLLLSSASVAVGLLLASGGLEMIKSARAASIPRAAEIAIDARVAVFAVAISLLTGVGFGLTPLSHVARRNLQNALKSAASSTTGAAGVQRFRQALVVGELALALTLLIGTGLMLRAFWNLQEVHAGFDPKKVETMYVALPNSTYGDREARDFWTRLETRLNTMSGVENAALSTGLPPVYPANYNDIEIEGFVPAPGGPIQNVDFEQTVSKGYFNTLRMRLVEGRFFDERDSSEAPGTAVINQTMARTFWGNRSAAGRRVRSRGATNWCTVVGVIADAKNNGLEKPTGTEVYFPFTQNTERGASRSMFITVRAAGVAATTVNGVRRVLSEMDPTLPLTKIRTMEELVSAAQSRPRFLTLLLTLFAGVALILAAVGIYGVISYSVARRTREFGLRMALGAQRSEVLGLVLGRGLRLACTGVLIGLAASFALTRFLASMLFGVTPTDPATFVIVPVVLATVACLAAYIPAHRATKVDPMEALRHE